jgi:hypothetical protein
MPISPAEARGLRLMLYPFACYQTLQCIPVLSQPLHICVVHDRIAFLDGAAGAFLSPVPLLLQALNSLVYPFISDSFSIGTSLCSSSLRRHWNARICLEHFNGSCLRCPCSPCFNFSLRFPVLCATRRCLILKSRPLIPDTGLKPLNRCS